MINDNVTSDLCYCYSLLYGAKQPNIDLLQCCKIEIQALCLKNCTGFPWNTRSSYKIMLFTYKDPISAVLRNIP